MWLYSYKTVSTTRVLLETQSPFLTMEKSIYHEGITIINMHASKNKASKHMKSKAIKQASDFAK